MLKVIRESAIERPWFYRTLMVLIAAVFVVTMGWWGFEENKEDIIVRVGDDKVSRTEYLQAYKRLTEQYRFLKQEGVISTDVPEDQLKQQVIDQLIESRLWSRVAREMGVVVTVNELRDSIVKIPAFQNNGKFDPELYKRVLAQNQLTPEQFEAVQRAELMREKARMLVRESVAPTADELAMAQAILASQPTPAVPMQDSAQTDRALQAVLRQKQQRALLAYQEGLRARTPISVRRELM
ncbi:MAG: hypothetical protein E6K68_03765 [Nitrospirae bacterium]|nr:MAG: hypothetical protein E6K68_03765 [Nitrospirota bacterium]